MTNELPYGKLDVGNAHAIASGANGLLNALQEYIEEGHPGDDPAARLAKKGVDMGDTLLEAARLLTSRGVFSNEKYLSELLIYSAAIVDNCEVCALTHIEGAVRAKAPEAVVDVVQAIALYVMAQAEDDTYLLFDTYIRHWQRFEVWPQFSSDKESNLRFYNLIALLMSLVVRKRRLVRLHARELLTRSKVTPEEILEIIGIAQVMGGFPSRWEVVHIHDVICELHETGELSPAFAAVLDKIPHRPDPR